MGVPVFIHFFMLGVTPSRVWASLALRAAKPYHCDTHIPPPHPRGFGGFPVSTSSRKQIQVDLKGFPSTKRVGCSVCVWGGHRPKFPGIFLEISSIFQTFRGFVTPLSPVQLPVPFTHAALWGWCRQEPNLGLFYCKKKTSVSKSRSVGLGKVWGGGGWGGGGRGGKVFPLGIERGINFFVVVLKAPQS